MDVAALRSVPLFSSLDSKAMATLGEYLTIHDYPKAATIFQTGDAGDAMYLIEVGEVRISITDADGVVVPLAELGPGDFFGDMSLIDGQGRSATATATENARLAKLRRDDFLSFIRSDPRVTLELLTALTNRLRRTDDLLRHRVSRNVNQEEEARLTIADRAADRIAEFGGSWKFIILFMVFIVLWMAVNSWLLVTHAFDAPPYLLLSTALNVVAALQAPIIMMSQNRQSYKDRLRANLDYQVNLKNELLLGDIMRRLDELKKRSRD
jgi:CRP/FNR family transcriptional regulator, cyclic AMP receptor protein